MGSEGRLATGTAPGYDRVRELLEAQRCVVLDGGIGTELPGLRETDDRLWGIRAVLDDPGAVLDVHRRYVASGCDVITTDTWGLPSGLLENGPRLWANSAQPVHWMDVARRGLALAREAVDGAPVAVAFSLNGDVDANEGQETIRLLDRVFADGAPDLVLVETLSLVRPSLYDTVERLLDTGLPVWLSFRRCRHGLCGVYGEHWGGPEGDAFGRAARRFEEMGIGALLVNCIPPDHVDGMVSFLRDFTDLPLGVYPNLGYLTSAGWQFAEGVGGEADNSVSVLAESGYASGGGLYAGNNGISNGVTATLINVTMSGNSATGGADVETETAVARISLATIHSPSSSITASSPTRSPATGPASTVYWAMTLPSARTTACLKIPSLVHVVCQRPTPTATATSSA